MQKSQPLVSIIVPVYNAGPYLRQRIESLIGQSLQEIEIIFVLDSPDDGSDQMVQDYAQRDNRIKVIVNKGNLHTGLSRNAGLSVAGGDYVAFADHDDFCEPEMYEKLYRKAKEKQSDIVFCDMCFEKKDVAPVSKIYFKEPEEKVRERILEELLKGNGFYYSILNHLYRLTFLREHDIQFIDTRQITLEDRYFNLLAYHYARKVTYIPGEYIHHVLYRGSTQHTYAFKSLIPMVNHLEMMCLFFRKHPEYEAIFRENFGADAIRKLYNSFLPEIRYKFPVYAFRMLGRIKEKSALREALKRFGERRQWRELPLKLKCFYGLLRLFS